MSDLIAPVTPEVAAPVAPVVAETAPAGPAKRIAPEWSRALNREARNAKDREALASERTALAAQRKEIEAQQKRIEENRRSPLKLIEAMGVTPEKFNEMLLTGKESAPELESAALRSELRRQREELEAFRNQSLERETARETAEREAREQRESQEAEQAVTQWRQQTVAAIHAAKDRYPLTAAMGQGSQVAQRIEAHFEKTGQRLDVDEAARAIEADLAKSVPSSVEQAMAVPAFRAIIEAALKKAGGGVASIEVTKPAPKKASVLTEDQGLRSRPPPVGPKNSHRDDVWNTLSEKRGI